MKKTIFLAILLLGVISAKAQENQDETISANVEAKKGFWSIHFGPTFPLADFSDDNDNNYEALGAAVGVGAGLEFSYPLNDSGFGFFMGFDVLFFFLQRHLHIYIAINIRLNHLILLKNRLILLKNSLILLKIFNKIILLTFYLLRLVVLPPPLLPGNLFGYSFFLVLFLCIVEGLVF
jgi:hypothetical protein